MSFQKMITNSKRNPITTLVMNGTLFDWNHSLGTQCEVTHHDVFRALGKDEGHLATKAGFRRRGNKRWDFKTEQP